MPRLVACGLVLATLSACHPRPAPPVPAPPPAEPARPPASAEPPRAVSLLAGGDVTLGQRYQEYFDQEVAKGRSREELFLHGFRDLRALTLPADLFVVNLECPFTERGERLPKNFNFRARPEFAQSLALGGVDAVSLANNHLMDFGPEGLLDTLMTLEQARIPYFGAGRTLAEARRPALVTVGGVRFAFLGYLFLGEASIEPAAVYATDTTPGVAGHPTDVAEVERMVVEDVEAARRVADVVLPFFHWGREGTAVPEGYQVRLARAAVQAGAAGVLGSHPHVLQAMAEEGGAPVIYSLGNLVFGGNWNPRDKRSALYRARVGPGGVLESEVLPLQTDRMPDVPFQPFPLTGAAREDVLRYLADLSASQPTPLPALAPWRTRADGPRSPPP